MFTFTTVVSHSDGPIWGRQVAVPLGISQDLLKDGTTRFLITLNGSEPMHKALMPDGQGGSFIIFNKEVQKKYDLKEGAIATVTVSKDESEYGMPMPEEMAVLMQQDPEGNACFHSLTKGKQRSLLYIIGKPKTSDTRLNKALVVLDYLKAAQGKLDFKELNIAFKESRNF